tara:strand:- start:3990 stop:4226 length:237 start_codon:yes stop_codon:yes gene_type:complete
MDYSKIFKFLALIVVILFFSYLNSHRDVENNNKNTKESFTSNIREYYNKNKRYVRRNIEDFKTTGLNTIESFYKKYNN